MILSIVVPCYNEEESLPHFYKDLLAVLVQNDLEYELLFVDDGSIDGTKAIIREFCDQNPVVRGIILSRNFGHQSALIAGMEEAKGGAVLTMDADLQHPPGLIPQMLEKLTEGYDVVNTVRDDTEDSTFFKRLTSSGFYFLINWMSEVEIRPGAADFRVMTRKATDAFLRFKEKARFNRGLVSWMGFKTYYLAFNAPSRVAGQTKYSLKKMLRFARTGITSFSPKPLKVASFFGMLSVLAGLIYGSYVIVQVLTGQTVAGWASTVLLILLLGGIQMVSIGVLGEYIAKIYDEAKSRPLYFIQEVISKDQRENEKE